MAERSRSDTIQLKARMKEPLRAKLEAAAAAKGISLNAEMVHRLESSFLNDEAGDREFGGRQLRALFGLLGNAAVLIEQQTQKPYFEDRNTFVAVQEAWRRLIAAFGPTLTEETFRALEEAATAPVPKLPVPPLAPAGMLLGEPDQYRRQFKDYEAALKIYKKESTKYEKEGEALRRINENVQAQIALGKDVAVSLLPERPKKKA